MWPRVFIKPFFLGSMTRMWKTFWKLPIRQGLLIIIIIISVSKCIKVSIQILNWFSFWIGSAFESDTKENRTFSHSDHCNDPFPNHKLHIQIIIIWCYHYYSKQLFAKKWECLLKNIPKINEKPIFSVFSETLIPQFVKADKYLDMIFRTSFYTSMID